MLVTPIFTFTGRDEAMNEEALREQLYGQVKNRAMMYWHIFEAIRDEIGEERAVAVMKKAIYNRGLSIGKRLSSYASTLR